MTGSYISLETLEREMDLKNLTPDVDMTLRHISIPEINRPALQLTGFFEHFENERVQIIGHVEQSYLDEIRKIHHMETKKMMYKHKY